MSARRRRPFAWAALAIVVSACSTTPGRHATGEPSARGPTPSSGDVASPTARKGGGYYLDDGPGDHPPADLDLLPDAVPRVEKYASGANRPYNVFGVDYVPDLSGAPYRQRGVGSWYGRKFHGQRTSSGEIYDMYAMTAAHPTLPIPCYALVTNLSNGKSVIVRVNDRGPFLHNRIMDLSYAAALKVGYLSSGSGLIEVEMLTPADIAAGRIPVTTNSLFIAAATANGQRRAPTVDAPPRPIGEPAVVVASRAPIAADREVGSARRVAGRRATAERRSRPAVERRSAAAGELRGPRHPGRPDPRSVAGAEAARGRDERRLLPAARRVPGPRRRRQLRRARHPRDRSGHRVEGARRGRERPVPRADRARTRCAPTPTASPSICGPPSRSRSS